LEFEKLKKKNKDYQHFRVIEESDLGLIFACSHLQPDKSCGIHEDRPDFCRKYPNEATMLMGGNLSPECSYRFEKRFSFEDKLSDAEQPNPLKFSSMGKLLNANAIIKPKPKEV
jgi:Fe-S-cluster containining protein